MISCKLYGYWSDGERTQDDTEQCAVATKNNETLMWLSYACDLKKPFLCMGASGVVMSRECKKHIFNLLYTAICYYNVHSFI